MITLGQGTDRSGRSPIFAQSADWREYLYKRLEEWGDDQLRGYSGDDVAPSPIKNLIIAERVRRQKQRFKIEQGFTDEDIDTDYFEVLFRIWVEDQL